MTVQLWPDKEAQQILKFHGADADKIIIVETGFGPSGKPHFGTFGEVVRTNYVMLAMNELGYKTKLIAYSDDLDGLRKIPEGFPGWLKDYIGHPVSRIPDPFEEYESFSARMNALLVKMLDELQLEYELRISSVCYPEGTFNEQIKMVIQNYEAVQDIIFPYLRDETKEHWFPFFPLCENCGSISHTRVTAVDKENLILTYICDREFGGVMGCEHTGKVHALNGNGKLQWKVDWPARWHAFGVHYEMFGKDLIESAEVGDRIVQRIFKGKPPVHMFYEMFLDDKGRKISKSKGTGMTAEEWQRYGTHDSLMLLMMDKPREATKLYPGIIPRYVDTAMKAADAYFSGDEKQAREARTYKFIRLGRIPLEPPVTVDFTTLVNLVGNVGLENPVIVEDYLRRSRLVEGSLSDNQRRDLHDLILKARRYYDEQMVLELAEPEFDGEDGFLLGQLVAKLEAQEWEADALHNELFQIAKNHNVDPKKFFRALYFALIKQERGPRGGAFIKLLGQEKAIELIRQRIAESVKPKEPFQAETVPSGTLLPVTIAEEVKQRYPDMVLGAAVIDGVTMQDDRSEDLEAAIASATRSVQGMDIQVAISQGAIDAYRQLFTTFGANPNATPPSPQNILRIAVNDNRLPNVNNVVDTVNLTVLETGLSAAVYDMQNLDLPLTLRFAQKGDKHLPLGGRQVESVEPGELVYADASEVICRALNYRDSDKTKITTKTQTVVLIVDGSPGISAVTVLETLQQQVRRIIQYAGGTVKAQGLLF